MAHPIHMSCITDDAACLADVPTPTPTSAPSEHMTRARAKAIHDKG
jgi:hypothetical protein